MDTRTIMKNILALDNKQQAATLLNDSNYYCAYNPNLHKQTRGLAENLGGKININTLKVKEY